MFLCGDQVMSSPKSTKDKALNGSPRILGSFKACALSPSLPSPRHLNAGPTGRVFAAKGGRLYISATWKRKGAIDRVAPEILKNRQQAVGHKRYHFGVGEFTAHFRAYFSGDWMFTEGTAHGQHTTGAVGLKQGSFACLLTNEEPGWEFRSSWRSSLGFSEAKPFACALPRLVSRDRSICGH